MSLPSNARIDVAQESGGKTPLNAFVAARGANDPIRIAVDVKQRRPGCVLLQAAFGCGRASHLVGSLFDTRTWLLAPTDNFAIVSGTLDDVKRFAAECNARARGEEC